MTVLSSPITHRSPQPIQSRGRDHGRHHGLQASSDPYLSLWQLVSYLWPKKISTFHYYCGLSNITVQKKPPLIQFKPAVIPKPFESLCVCLDNIQDFYGTLDQGPSGASDSLYVKAEKWEFHVHSLGFRGHIFDSGQVPVPTVPQIRPLIEFLPAFYAISQSPVFLGATSLYIL